MDNVLIDANRDAFLKAVMDARSLAGVELAMDHYDRLINQINRLQASEAHWRKLAKRLQDELDRIQKLEVA
jgi:hypothetical protein